MEKQKHLMKSVLDDTRLNRLRLEGGTVLARIRKEEACENENYRYCRLDGHDKGQYKDNKMNFSSSVYLFSLFFLEMLSTC